MTAPVDLVHRFTPRGAARQLFECRDSEVLMAGPAGTGKSTSCLTKLHMMALLNPGMRALIVRKTLASLGSTALDTWRKAVVPEALKTGIVTFYGGSAQEPPQYRYSNGSCVIVGGMDKPSKIMSSDYDVVFVQEATELTIDDWEALTTRLRNGRISFQQLLADCNPDAGHHWLNQRCAAGATTMLHSRHEDNPALYDEIPNPDGGPPTYQVTERGAAYMAKLDALTGVRYQRLRLGRWVAAEGMIYEEWDTALHVIDRFPIPPEWTRWWVVDFGFTHPFAFQWWASDPDGRLYLYREIHHTKRTVDQHAAAIIRQVTRPDPDYQHPAGQPRYAYHGRIWTEPKPRAIIADHDAEGRAVLERELGLSTTAATKTVTEGIQAVQMRLRPAGDGKPRLYLMRDSLVERDRERADAKKPTCVAEEIVGYVWDTGAGKAAKETPVKLDDDGCDAMRYVVAEQDLAARPRLRWL